MIQDFIITSDDDNKFIDKNLFDDFNFEKYKIYLAKDKYKFFSKGNTKYFVIGNINGYYEKNLNLKKLSSKLLFKFLNSRLISKLDGRFVVIKITNRNKLEIFNDFFSRYEVYFYQKDQNILISNNLKVFFNKKNFRGKIDITSLSHSLSIYGNRPFKADTIFTNVKRLTPNQWILLNKKKLFINKIKFEQANINENFTSKNAKEYTNAFLKTLKIKSSKKLNIIFMSSGWDSSSILAGLVKINGPKRIQCVIGRMKYSKNLVANSFEILRAKKICEFFKVKLNIINFNYYKKDILKDENLIFFFKEQSISKHYFN